MSFFFEALEHGKGILDMRTLVPLVCWLVSLLSLI